MTSQEHVAFAEGKLAPYAAVGRKATFVGVPIERLSHEALLGLVGYLGEEQIRQDEGRERERAMRKDIARARGRHA